MMSLGVGREDGFGLDRLSLEIRACRAVPRVGLSFAVAAALAAAGCGGGPAGGLPGAGGSGGTAGIGRAGSGGGGAAGIAASNGGAGSVGVDGGTDGGAGAGDGGTPGSIDGAAGGATDAPSEAPTSTATPSLTKCTEYDHSPVTCDLNTGAGDPSLWSIAFSPDGSLLVTAGEDGRVKVWTHNAGVLTAEGHVLPSNDQGFVAFSPDGTLLAVGSNLGSLVIYATSTWTAQATLTGNAGQIDGVGFSPDGARLFAADASGLLTVHAVGGAPQPSLMLSLPAPADVLGISPVFTTSDQWVGVGYNDGTGELINFAAATPTRVSLVVTSNASPAYGLGFSPDGKTMAAGGDDGVTRFWTIPAAANAMPTGPTIKTLDGMGAAQGVNAIAYAPNGLEIAQAVGSPSRGGLLGAWDATTHELKGMRLPAYFPASVAWSRTGLVLAAGEYDCGRLLVCAD